MISTKQRQEIKYLQKMTFSSDVISKSMNIPVEQVCDIMGYPKDEYGRNKAARDYNYYEHGMDETQRIYVYSIFLEEGDFEKWQPTCYMDKLSDEFLNLKAEADDIPESTDPIVEIRRLWILNRFTTYQKEEWKRLRDLFKIQMVKIPELVEFSKKAALERYNSL